MRDVECAKQFLSDGATFALVKDVEVFSTDRKGIAPLLELAEQGKNLSGFSAADKIVGKPLDAKVTLYVADEARAAWETVKDADLAAL